MGNQNESEHLSFAEVLQDYMWSQRPPITAAQLARQIGISKQTVGNWLNGRTVPQVGTLALVSQRTGIALETLARALGQTPPPQTIDLGDYVVQRLETDPELSEELRIHVARRVREIVARYHAERAEVARRGDGSQGAYQQHAGSGC